MEPYGRKRSDSTSLVYRAKMHSHSCDCWVYGTDTPIETTGDYLVFLSQSYTLLQLLPSTELREGISSRVIQVRDLDPTRTMAQFVTGIES